MSKPYLPCHWCGSLDIDVCGRELNGLECKRKTFVSEPTALETQHGGDHYKNLKIQPFEYSLANGLGPCEHSVLKYISRWRDKNGLEDLRKAKHILDILIEWEETHNA